MAAVTLPKASTDAEAGLVLLHVPPLKPGTVSGIEVPTHTAVAPLITGTALTVIVALPVIVLVQPVVVFTPITV